MEIFMEAKGQPLNFLWNTQILEIPFFQRPYVWKKDNWQELWDDLFREKGRHFLGSIILKWQNARAGEPNRAIVIDGQQRLTTLSILIKAMYDSLDGQAKQNAFSAVSNALFYKQNAMSSEYLISINHSFNDSKQFEQIIGSVVSNNGILQIDAPLKNSLDAISDGENLKNCYKFFIGELQSKSEKEILDLFNSLFDNYNKILVVIDLDNDDQEQQIFDTINSAGIRLTASDTIKNALFQRLIDITGDKEKICKYYKATWEKTFLSDVEEQNFWSKQKAVGRLKRDNSELLLHAVAIIDGFFDVEKDTISELAKKYKEHLKNLNEAELKSLVSEIMNYATLYKKYLQDFDKTESFEFDNQGKRLAHILSVSDTSTFNPYILFLYKHFENDTQNLQKRLSQIENMVIRYLISGKTTKNFNKNCSEFIAKTKDTKFDFDKYFKDNFSVSNEDVVKGISTGVTNKLGTLILFWIELHRRFIAQKYDTKMLQYNYQLEHIMPQKWEEHWSNDSVPYVDENGTTITNLTDGKIRRNKKITSLGNMTLLNGKLNDSISNNTFQKKIEGEGRNAGVRKYASLSITKDDVVAEYDKDGIWNEHKIEDREQKLASEILTIWD